MTATPVCAELVAGNERCAAATLQHLAADPDERVRVVVAQNLSCPTEALRHLSGDGQPDDVSGAARGALSLRERRFVSHNPRF